MDVWCHSTTICGHPVIPWHIVDPSFQLANRISIIPPKDKHNSDSSVRQLSLSRKQKPHWRLAMWSCHPLPLPHSFSARATVLNSPFVAHLSPRGVTRGLSVFNGLPLCHCRPISVHGLKDTNCPAISHNVQQPLNFTFQAEFIGLCDGDKGRLVGSWTQKANTMYGFE